MASRLFRGDAPPLAQVTKLTPANVVAGDSFTVTCNGKNITYVALASTALDVVNGLAALVQASTIPEFQEMLATAVPTTGAAGPSDGSYITLTAVTAGQPFTVTTSTAVTSAGNISIVETTPGQSAVNEVHKISLVGTYTGGTFTITYNFGGGNETTGTIAYNANSATVQTALEGLATPVPGDIAVTGGPGPNTPWFVTFKGALAGTAITPGTINGGSLTGNGSVQIATTQDGNGLSTDLQCYTMDTATAGTYTLTLDGQTTGNIAYNATAATVQTALQALPNIGSGNVLVFGVGGGAGNQNKNYFWVQFAGALAGTNVSLLTLNAGNLSYTQLPVMQTLQNGGQTTADDYQVIDLGGATSGTFSVTYNGVTSSPVNVIPNSNSPTLCWLTLRNAIAAAAGINATTDVVVLDVFQTGGQGIEVGTAAVTNFLVHFTGAKANTAMQSLTVNGGGLTGSSGQTVTRLSAGHANVNEIQTITIFGTGGTFTLTENAQTTSAIAVGAAAGTVQTRIQTDLAATIVACTVTGTGTLADPYIVTVTNPGNTNIAQMTGNGASITGGGGTITRLTQGAAGVNEVQTVTEGTGINGGTFTLAFNGAVTAPQAWNVTNTNLQTALRGLSTIGGTNVNVAGSAGGPYTVTFVGTLAATNVSLLVGDGSLLTGATGTQTLVAATLTFSRGPNHYNDPINWTGGRVPDSGDAEFFEEGTSDCLYGMQQIATFTANAGSDTVTFTSPCDLIADQVVNVTNAGGGLPGGLAAATPYYLINVNRDAGTCQLALTSGGAAIDITTAGTGTHTIGIRLASLEFNSKYSGAVGLSKLNNAGYYEYRPLYLHIGLQASGAKTITIGTGSGSGSGKLQLDTDVDLAAVKVIASGGSSEGGIPTILWKGTNPSSTVNLIDGDMGIALYAGETALVAPLTMRGGNLELGAGATITGIDKTGGTLLSNGATINGTCVL